MKSAVLLAVAAASLVACSSGPRATGNQNYVGVGPVWTEAEAYPMAEAHCFRYGRSARFNAKAGVRYIFDCI